MRSEVADPRAATPGPAVALHEINSGAERSRDCLEFGQHDPGYAGEGGRLAGLGDSHVAPDAEENKGVLHAHSPLAGKQPGSLPRGLPHGVRVLDGGAVGDPSVLRFANRLQCWLLPRHRADLSYHLMLHSGMLVSVVECG